MQTIPNAKPSPRLLYSVVPDLPETKDAAEESPSRARLKGSGTFFSSGAIIFLGILVGALLVSAAGFVFSRRAVGTHETAAQKPSVSVPAGLFPKSALVQLPAGALKVSSISLGQPHLAVINGKTVTEGDSITVTVPSSSATVNLRIVTIADSRIDLSDGTKILALRFNLAPRE